MYGASAARWVVLWTGLLTAGLAAWTATGCRGEGRLVLVLDRPNPGIGLDPLEDPRLDHFTLVVRDRGGEPVMIHTAPIDLASGEAPLGNVPVDTAASVTLTGYSATNQVLAWAEGGPLNLDDSGEIVLHLAVRKPFTYVAGGPAILGFDTTLTGAEDVARRIGTAGGYTMDVASTPDGRTLLVSIGDPVSAIPTVSPSLQLISTATHTAGRAIPLSFVPGALSLSPDGRWAVVSEYQPPDVLDQADQVAVIDVQAALEGAPNAAKTLNMANAGRVAFARNRSGEDLAVILRAPLGPVTACEEAVRPATVNVVRLWDGTLAGPPVDLGDFARDIASDPQSNTAYIALSCANRIVAFDVDENGVVGAPWSLPAPASLQISGTTLWVGSTTSADPGGALEASLVVHRIAPYTDPQTEPEQMEIAFPSEAVVMQSGGGAQLLVDMTPYWVMPYRLAIPPGGGSVSALVIGQYHADSIRVSDSGGTWDTPVLDLVSASYVGIDVGTQDVRRRFRARCLTFRDGSLDPDPDLPCRALPPNEQPEGGADFFPRGATSIYGVP